MANTAVIAIRRIDGVKPQLESLAKRLDKLDDLPEGLADTVKAMAGQLDSIRAEFVRPENSDEVGARLLDKVRSLSGSVGRAAYPPTAAQADWVAQLQAELTAVVSRLDEVLQVRLPALNRQMNEAGVPRIVGF